MKVQSGAYVIGLFGLPRSGTTLLTAMIAAHSKAVCVYEPWHSKGLRLDQTQLADLMPLVRARDKQVRLICAKETATKNYYLANLDALLTDAAKVSRTGLVWIVRRPIDTFLSQVAADHRWRKGVFNPSPANFKYWAEITHATFVHMSSLLTKYNSRVVYYDYLTAHPQQALEDLMPLGGLDFEHDQLNYHETIDRRVIRGDRFVMDEARPAAIQSKEKYARKISDLMKQYSGNKHLSYILQISEAVSRDCDHGIIESPNSIVSSLIDCGVKNFVRD